MERVRPHPAVDGLQGGVEGLRDDHAAEDPLAKPVGLLAGEPVGARGSHRHHRGEVAELVDPLLERSFRHGECQPVGWRTTAGEWRKKASTSLSYLYVGRLSPTVARSRLASAKLSTAPADVYR